MVHYQQRLQAMENAVAKGYKARNCLAVLKKQEFLQSLDRKNTWRSLSVKLSTEEKFAKLSYDENLLLLRAINHIFEVVCKTQKPWFNCKNPAATFSSPMIGLYQDCYWIWSWNLEKDWTWKVFHQLLPWICEKFFAETSFGSFLGKYSVFLMKSASGKKLWQPWNNLLADLCSNVIEQHLKSLTQSLIPKKSVQQIRYVDHFCYGFSPTHRQSEEYRCFLTEELHKFFPNKRFSKLRHVRKKNYFAGFDVYKPREKECVFQVAPIGLMRIASYYGYGDYSNFQSTKRGFLEKRSLPDILQVYRNELRRVMLYFQIAENQQQLNSLLQLARWSFLKTVAAKHKTTTAQMKRRLTLASGRLGVVVNNRPILFPILRDFQEIDGVK